MAEFPDSLPKRIQEVLDVLPPASAVNGAFVYDRAGAVLYCQPFLRTFLDCPGDTPLNVKDLFSTHPAYSASRMDFFPGTASLGMVAIRILSDQAFNPKFQYAEFFNGVPAFLHVRPLEGLFVAFIYPMPYFMERAIGRVTPDMLAILAEDDEVILYCSQVKSIASRTAGERLFMHQFTDPEKWGRLLGRDKTVLDYFRGLLEKSGEAGWSALPGAGAPDPGRWIGSLDSRWRIEDGVFRTDPEKDNVFITSMETADQRDRDVRIEFNADLGDFLSAGVCLMTNIYHAQSEHAYPDAEGYNFQIYSAERLGGPLQTVSARLKRNGELIGIQEIPLDRLISENGFDRSDLRLSFERSCGGVFTLRINGVAAARLFDTVPLRLEHNRTFGLLGGRRTRFGNLCVLARPSLFEDRNIPPDSMDLTFYRMPGRIFETRIGRFPGEFGFLNQLRYVYMKDVTHSRELTERLNRTIRDIDDELNTARRIQNHMARLKVPDNDAVGFSYLFRPSGKVGGDMLDIKELEENKYALVIYDVTGHGIAASLISAMAKTSFENAFKHTSSPSLIIEEVNKDLCALTDPAMFLTAFVAVIDLEKRALTYSRAGHPIPAIFSRERPAPLLLENGSPIIGNTDQYDCPQFRVSIREKDRLILYTDGLTEIRNRSDEFFDRKDLFALVQNTLDLPLREVKDRIFEAAVSFRGGDQFDDDIAMILVDIKKTGTALAEVQV